MAKARILAVDDQRYFRSFLEEILGGEGYEVRSAADGREAIQLLDEGYYDVVVTDVVMPGLSGTELVERVKAIRPDQDVIVVTGVGDVRTAVDAMRAGASDYLLKPLDPTLLCRSLEALLQRRRLRHEHASLMAENLEYLGALSLYERSIALFSTVEIEPLAARILDALCLELRTDGGALWFAEAPGSHRLRLMATRGLDAPDEEIQDLDAHALPGELAALSGGEAGAMIPPAPEPELYIPFRQQGQLVALARLSARRSAGSYEDADRSVAERLAAPAAIAIQNALRHASMESHTFRDPVTQTYTTAFFEDMVESEVRKAGRFGRSFSLLMLELEEADAWRAQHSRAEWDRCREEISKHLNRVLRTTDSVAALDESRFAALLPETDAIGATVLKRRVREILRPRRDVLPGMRIATVAYPFDAADRGGLASMMRRRLDDDAGSLVRSAQLAGRSFSVLLEALSQYGTFVPGGAFDSIARFVLSEVNRRAGERGMVGVAPGSSWLASAREGLARLDPAATRAEIVLVSDTRADFLAGSPITVVPPERVDWPAPFLFYYAEGPAYALVGDSSRGEISGVWQTSDRGFVEEMAFSLQTTLGMSVGR